MLVTILATLSVFVLLSYSFEFIGKKIKLPTVILLLGSGMLAQVFCNWYGITVPYIDTLLPVLGTVGLILIVLEGAMDLKLEAEKKTLIFKAFLSAVVLLFSTSFLLAEVFHYFFDIPFRVALANAVPFGIISSAVAIPSANFLKKRDREFIVYESSFSDILGIVLFNYITISEDISLTSAGIELWNVVLMIGISLVVTVLLSAFISRVTHHVKFLPIIALLILMYAFSKELHLSPLILIFITGLLLNNSRILSRGIIKDIFHPEALKGNVESFKTINAEGVFVARTFFFVAFGFSVPLHDIQDIYTAVIAIAVVAIIFFLRSAYLFASRNNLVPLVFYAPRGLITVLLFLSLPEEFRSEHIGNALIVMTVLLSIGMMVVGNFSEGKEKIAEEPQN